MKQDNGFGLRVWGVAQVKDVSIGTKATNDMGTWWSVNGLTLGARRDFAVVADADAGLLTPEVGPPRALVGGADDGTLLFQCLLVGGVRGDGELAVDFVLVGVGQE